MQFLIQYYIIIISVGFFLIFTLIGYLVEMYKKQNKKNKEETFDLEQIKVEEINETILESNTDYIEKKEEVINIKEDNGDELLENYDNS